MINLKNVTRVARTFNLPCGAGECAPFSRRENSGGCFCNDIETQLVEETPDGTKGTRTMVRRLAGSITIRGRSDSGSLPDWAKEAPEIKAALAAGYLRLVEQ